MQRRGKRLSEYLNKSLNALNTEYLSRGEQYVYSQKELAVFASVSRETIRKHQGSLMKPYLHFLLKNIVWIRTRTLPI